MSDPAPVLRTAEEIGAMFNVEARTVRMWARRKHITEDAGRYDLREVLHWWNCRRNARMATLRSRRCRTR